jgi:putative restriction endonuclease
MKFTSEEQRLIRQDIFRWLDEQQVSGKYEFTRDDLNSYTWFGQRIPLVSMMKGIWNPQSFDETLSILTGINSPYDDRQEDGQDLYLRYSYQARDGGDNIKLKKAFVAGTPLIYFEAQRAGHYIARYPVYIVEDDEINREFVVALDEQLRFFGDPAGQPEDQRVYVQRIIRSRVHQPAFRWNVMQAYQETCAVCHLKHVELLDAAHIITDSHELGSAHVTNGLSLCKIHHAAYDKNLLGITPDFEVRINQDLLLEVDGPMLKHGIQEMHKKQIWLPADRNKIPNKENLDFRFKEFVAA